jgi:hypothetical protein
VQTEKAAKGNPNRLTLEEILAGKMLADTEKIQENTEKTAGVDPTRWETTRYLQDITEPNAQVMAEVAEGQGPAVMTMYAYHYNEQSGKTIEPWSILRGS